jgi:catechol 2,3-dioxygenase-like lactoylglutathione lyase family enzyme
MGSLRSKLLIACIFAVCVAAAQLAPPNESGVTFGHLHVRTHAVQAHMQFWRDLLGGKASMVAKMQRVTLPGIEILIQEGDSAGGTAGTTIDHVGFRVRDLTAMLVKAKQAGFTVTSENSQRALAFLLAPDDIRVEFLEDKSLKSDQAAGGHVHIYTEGEASVREVEAWYVKMFGAAPTKRGPYEEATIPGSSVSFAVTKTPVVGTKGRALDHIGFEIRNLEAYCKTLESKGVNLDVPYRVVKDLGLALAFVTDPKGTYIELNETLEQK